MADPTPATPWTMPHFEAPAAILTANGCRIGTFSIPQDATLDEKADCLATMYDMLRTIHANGIRG